MMFQTEPVPHATDAKFAKVAGMLLRALRVLCVRQSERSVRVSPDEAA